MVMLNIIKKHLNIYTCTALFILAGWHRDVAVVKGQRLNFQRQGVVKAELVLRVSQKA